MSDPELVVDPSEFITAAHNADEDLHFSTFYLRASLLADHPWTYTRAVAIYEEFDETYYLPSREVDDVAARLLAHATNAPGYLRVIAADIIKRSGELAAASDPAVDPLELHRWPTSQLIDALDGSYGWQRLLYAVARIPEALDRGSFGFTRHLRGLLATVGLIEPDLTHAFVNLTAPPTRDPTSDERADFEWLVDSARTHGLDETAARVPPWHFAMHFPPPFAREVETHAVKWAFSIYHGYGHRNGRSVQDVAERIRRELVSHIPDVAARPRPSHSEDVMDLLPKSERHLFAEYGLVAHAKAIRRHEQLRGFAYLDKLIAEVSQRLDLTEAATRMMIPDELIRALESGDYDRDELIARLSGCVVLLTPGHEQVLVGDAAAGVAGRLRARLTDTEDLTGLTVVPGRVTAPAVRLTRGSADGIDVQGRIVVADALDPDLIPYIGDAAAILTEQGGVTAHASLYCRELGIPTIMGIGHLLAAVRDGDLLMVDAFEGRVTVDAGNRSNVLLDRQAMSDYSRAGDKVANLMLARKRGYLIPDMAVLPLEEASAIAGADRHRRDTLREIVLAAIGAGPDSPIIVRTSAPGEDRSPEPLLRTYRSISGYVGRDLWDAVEEFLNENLPRGYAGAVVLQRELSPSWSGVALSAVSTSTRRSMVVIEHVRGVNRPVTAGTTRPARTVVNEDGDIASTESRQRGDRMPRQSIATVRAAVLDLEAGAQSSVAVEWAIADGELVVLQVKPVSRPAEID